MSLICLHSKPVITGRLSIFICIGVEAPTLAQNTDRQLPGEAFDKEFEDKISAKDTNRPALHAMTEFVR